MIANVNNLENRIVKFKRISSNGEEVSREVELRKMSMGAGEPRSATVRLTLPVNVVTTLDYDSGRGKFSGLVGTDTWESDFDWNKFVRSNKLGNADSYIKSPKRWRNKN